MVNIFIFQEMQIQETIFSILKSFLRNHVPPLLKMQATLFGTLLASEKHLQINLCLIKPLFKDTIIIPTA